MKLTVPPVGAEEIAAVARVIQSGHLTQGPETEKFEALIRSYVGTEFAFATSSATTGLHLVLEALGVQPEAAVVMPAFSFPATANAAVQLGARPVFVDIDIDTFTMDPSQLLPSLSEHVSAVMPVHAFGLPADMTAIHAVVSQHGIPVVEDAACALGASIDGRRAGSLGTAGVFSFHPRKIITTGEGGMVTTDDSRLAERLRLLRSHGGVRGEHYSRFVRCGYNYRLSDVHAAIGVVQMSKLDDIARTRSRLAEQLTLRLAELDGVRPPHTPGGRVHAFQSYVVLLDDSVDRDQIIGEMRKRDVETTLGTYGLHLQPCYAERFGYHADMFPNATRAHRQSLTLPLYPGMRDGDLDFVVDALADSIPLARR